MTISNKIVAYKNGAEIRFNSVEEGREWIKQNGGKLWKVNEFGFGIRID